jgi:wyosine [tRNA(Phe)-imidazoG37] synthetase (radical SAM superfamily)
MIVYGPVPSRRLGQSLGINNIPPKICTYSCVYCQLGRTARMQIRREEFYQPEKLISDVKARLAELKERKDSVDYMTFVPDGEPTLDINLGREIELLRPFGVKIGVITNASLIWDADVRNALAEADWVSLKVDAVSERIWRRINRPYRDLRLEVILGGMVEFSTDFNGTLATETMLIRGINDGRDEIEAIADFLETLSPGKSYIAIPTRPPAERWVRPAGESSINMAYQIFSRRLSTEYLIGYEGNSFASTGDPEDDLLSITSVHPMREEGVEELLKKANSGWEIVRSLVHESKLVELEYEGKTFYMRKLPGVSRP